MAVTACGSHLSRSCSVVELTPLSCCGDAFGQQAGEPALRLEEQGEVDALEAAELTDGPLAGSLLLVVAVQKERFTLVRARLLTTCTRVVWLRELQLPDVYDAPQLRIDPRSGDVVVATGSTLLLSGAALLRWAACIPGPDAGDPTHACYIDNRVTLKINRIWALTLLHDGGLCVAGDNPVTGAVALLLPMREGAPAGELPDCSAALELRRAGAPLWPRGICHAALGAVGVTTGDGDIELFHSRSGRYLGRVFTSHVRGRWRWSKVCAAPAACSPGSAPGLVSWRAGPTGVQLLLHPPQTAAAHDASEELQENPPATAVTQRIGWCS